LRSFDEFLVSGGMVVFSEINMIVLLKAGYPWMECLFLGGMWDLQDDLNVLHVQYQVPSWLQHV
jgi:hypothetical protein